MTGVLSDDDAAELVDDGVLEPLASFIWPGTCSPQQYLGALIDRLGEHSVRLTQQLKAGEQGDESTDHRPDQGQPSSSGCPTSPTPSRCSSAAEADQLGYLQLLGPDARGRSRAL